MELRLLLLAARRSTRLVAGAALVGALLGLGSWALAPTVHQASAVLTLDSAAVTSPGQEPFTGDPERYVAGQMEALRSTSVLSRAGAELRPELPAGELAGAITLAHTTGNDVVRVTARADDPARAVEMANAVATAYVDLRAEAAQTALDDQRSDLQAQAQKTADQLSAAQLAKPVADALYAAYDRLNTAIADLDKPGVLHDDTRVLDPAQSSWATRGYGAPTSLVGGALLGALIGLGAALVRTLRRPRVAGQPEVESLTGRPVAAVFPKLRGTGKLSADAVAGRLRAPAGRLAAATAPEAGAPRPVVVTVCSAMSRAGCSTVAAAVALRLAEQGHRVTSVLADPAPALVSAGSGDGGWRTDEGGVAGLSLLTRAAGQLTGEDVAKALAEAAPGTDVVVVDASSVLDSSFARVAAGASDRVVLVVPALDQPEPDLRLALEVLGDATAAPVLVAVTHL